MSGGNLTKTPGPPPEGPHPSRNRQPLRAGRDLVPVIVTVVSVFTGRHRSPGLPGRVADDPPGEGEKTSIAQGILGKKLNA